MASYMRSDSGPLEGSFHKPEETQLQKKVHLAMSIMKCPQPLQGCSSSALLGLYESPF